jgi:hypothetical protein
MYSDADEMRSWSVLRHSYIICLEDMRETSRNPKQGSLRLGGIWTRNFLVRNKNDSHFLILKFYLLITREIRGKWLHPDNIQDTSYKLWDWAFFLLFPLQSSVVTYIFVSMRYPSNCKGAVLFSTSLRQNLSIHSTQFVGIQPRPLVV